VLADEHNCIEALVQEEGSRHTAAAGDQLGLGMKEHFVNTPITVPVQDNHFYVRVEVPAAVNTAIDFPGQEILRPLLFTWFVVTGLLPGADHCRAFKVGHNVDLHQNHRGYLS